MNCLLSQLEFIAGDLCSKFSCDTSSFLATNMVHVDKGGHGLLHHTWFKLNLGSFTLFYVSLVIYIYNI